MGQSLETLMLLELQSQSSQQEDQTTRAEQSADEGSWAVFHLSDARNHIGIRLKLGNSNSVVEVKAIKQADNSVVLGAVLKGCTSSSDANISPQQEATHAVQVENEGRRSQQGLGEGKSKRKDEENEWVKEMRGWLIVLATIVLSVAYQAGINPPGGVWQDDVEPNITAGIVGHKAGVPINQVKNPKSFAVFKWSNTLAMAQSLVMLLLLVKRTTYKHSMLYVHALRVLVVTSLLALATAYSVSDPGYSVTLVFYLLFANAFLTALLLIAVTTWRSDSLSDAAKEKLKKHAKKAKACLYLIICLSVPVVIAVYAKHTWPPHPWYGIVLSFLYAAGTILWVL